MNPLDLIRKFQAALPVVREWIDTTLEENRPNAVSVNTLTFPQLRKVFPLDLLSRAQVESGDVKYSGKLRDKVNGN